MEEITDFFFLTGFFISKKGATTVIESDVKKALLKSINHNHFFIMYQPIIDITQNKIGFEALARWNYEKKDISPTVFIPILEKMNLIEDLTKQVIEKVSNDWPILKEKAGDMSQISINISPTILNSKKAMTFLEWMIQHLKKNHIHPRSICLEITENFLINVNDDTNMFFEKAREQGFMIAIDDFGTGYSSISYLANHSFDVLKIDRFFIRQIDTSNTIRHISEAIINLSKQLNIKVIAEGVENEKQLEILKIMGIDAVQGFYFGKPKVLSQINSTIHS